MLATDSLVAVVEVHGCLIAALVEHVGHLVQHIVERHDAVRLQRLAIDGGREPLVGCQSEAQALLIATMCKDCHLALVGSWVQHDIHREALTHQVAFALRVGQCITIEAQRR